jgi:hypothetical protein
MYDGYKDAYKNNRWRFLHCKERLDVRSKTFGNIEKM